MNDTAAATEAARHDVQRAQRALDEALVAWQFAARERAELLRTLNRDNGISLYRLADWCGVSHQQMSRIVQRQDNTAAVVTANAAVVTARGFSTEGGRLRAL